MTTVSTRAFSQKPAHYLRLANKENVAIKFGKVVYQITPKPQFENISPSGDPYWGDPRNVAELKRIDKLTREGKNPVVATLHTEEDIDNYMAQFLS